MMLMQGTHEPSTVKRDNSVSKLIPNLEKI